MFRFVAYLFLVAVQVDYLLRHPKVIKTPLALIWLGLTLASFLMLFNDFTLPFSFLLGMSSFVILSFMVSRKKEKGRADRGSLRRRP